MAVNYKVGADVGSFKQGMAEAQASLKTLDAALKVNEASFKAGGDAEIYMQQKTQLLNDKMNQQKNLVTQLQTAMRQMVANGVSPTSVEYQKLEQKMLTAQTAMLETKNAIDGLDESQTKAADSAGNLADSVNSIGKKISLDQVISGINSITGAMEAAGRAAVQLGEKIWDNIMDTARLSDDYATMASRYGVDVEQLQKQLKVFDTMADTSIEAYYKARMKVNKAITNPTDDQLNILQLLGLAETTTGKFGETSTRILVDNAEDAIWEVGKKLREKVASGEITQDNADLFAQTIFGRSFDELNPLLEKGKEGFQDAVDAQTAATKQAIENNATLNDSVALLEKNWETFKIQVLGDIAPHLTTVTDSLSELINRFTEYAKSDEGQELLKSLGEAVGTMFDDLTKIDPEDAISKLSSVFATLKDGFVWIADHWEDVQTGLLGIAGAFGLMKVSEGVLTALKIISGFKGFGGGGSVTASAGGGLISGVSAWTGNAINKFTWMVGGALNGVALGDYIWNNTRIGQETRNTGDFFGAVRTAWDEKMAEIRNNAESFRNDWSDLFNQIFNGGGGGGGSHGFYVPVEPKTESNVAEVLSEQIGTVPVVVQPVFSGAGYGGSTGGGSYNLLRDIGNGFRGMFGFHANGIWSVPFDNYPALLHAGERVIPAREVNRSYNSNLYVEKMVMNNGADAQGLANAMAAAQRRRMSGYGS